VNALNDLQILFKSGRGGRVICGIWREICVRVVVVGVEGFLYVTPDHSFEHVVVVVVVSISERRRRRRLKITEPVQELQLINQKKRKKFLFAIFFGVNVSWWQNRY
jgi:hypothetical protein